MGALDENFLDALRTQVRRGSYRFTLHAAERMLQRHIAVAEVREALLSNEAEVIEDYPDESRGPSCLVLGLTAKGRLLHVQCSYPPRVAVITVYEPEPSEWINGRRRRGGRP